VKPIIILVEQFEIGDKLSFELETGDTKRSRFKPCGVRIGIFSGISLDICHYE